MVFKSRKELNARAQKYENEDDEDVFQDMTEYENDLMKKFQENDEEIDAMLDQVIFMAEKLHL